MFNKQYMIDRQSELIRYQIRLWLSRGMTPDQLKKMPPPEPKLLFEDILKEFDL